jgi:hypothetical protein
MEQLTAIAEYYKIRRADAGLSHIVDFQPAALVGGRLHSRLGIRKNIVEHPGRNAHSALVVNIVYELENAVDPLPGDGGDKQDRRVRHEAEIAHYVLSH